jgi:hypothetical protein
LPVSYKPLISEICFGYKRHFTLYFKNHVINTVSYTISYDQAFIFLLAQFNKNTRGMKKSMVVLILAVLAGIVSSCSIYSCPTYSKKVKAQPAQESKV